QLSPFVRSPPPSRLSTLLGTQQRAPASEGGRYTASARSQVEVNYFPPDACSCPASGIFAMRHTCPTCKKPTDSEHDADFPFCSDRCRVADLGAWASEKYVVSEPIFNEDDFADSE